MVLFRVKGIIDCFPISYTKISRPWSYGRIAYIPHHHWPKPINRILPSPPVGWAKPWCQPIRESDSEWHWQRRQRNKRNFSCFGLLCFSETSVYLRQVGIHNTVWWGGVVIKWLQEVSTANLHTINITFYPVDEKRVGKTWREKWFDYEV